MSLHIPFDNSYATLPEGFYTRLAPTPVRAADMLAWNEDLAAELGITGCDSAVFAGNVVPEGAAPLAQLYAGHQFGSFNPQLGDGRALLLGEVTDRTGTRRDIQLKGSGPTPYSRMGDGRAWLGPVLREYVISEAMHALGIPTTRALAAVATGEPVLREQGPLPGAVITRVAQSHLRVGTFQVFAHRGQIDDLRTLSDYTIARHYPDADGPMGLLAAVCSAQAELVAAWMSVGFIHGVMNTDNCTISGETIDYGPCAFMDAYHEARVFSSIDRGGRYAYANQPRIAVWNMAQLATSLIQLADDPETAVPEATAIVHAMPAQVQAAWLRRFGAKIGLADATPEDQPLIEALLALMQAHGSDFTNTFAGLSDGSARDQFVDRAGFDDWHARWSDHVGADAPDIMARANPQIIPRNHRVEAMIDAAVAGDMQPFDTLMTALAHPLALDPAFDHLRRPPTEDEIVPATFCGT
ncbi:MAG: YdiU family protein [Pseudomonadota bacterium]